MDASAFAEIVCIKCGRKYAAPGYSCSQCQGGLAKVCGGCGAKNSIAKNYCDHCGVPLKLAPAPGAASPAAAAPAPAAPAPAAEGWAYPSPKRGLAAAPQPAAQPPKDDDIPRTAIRSSGLPPAPKAKPAAKEPEPEKPKIGLPAAPSGRRFAIPAAGATSGVPTGTQEGITVPPKPATEPSMTRLRRRDRGQNMRFWLPLVLAAAAAVLIYANHHRPEKELPRAAAQYLDALSRQDFAGAYAMLSKAARTYCTLEEFTNLREATAWTWSDPRIARLEPEAAVVQYRLAVAGRPPGDDFLIFLREDGRWVRPFNWNLLQRAETAFERNDPDMALILSQEAVRIDPRDPMARGYLCEAVYYRKVPAETEKECSLALRLSETYPSKLTLKSLYHLHAILGDTYKNSLGKYAEAVGQYDAMLKFPDLGPADRCDLLLARADTRLAMGRAADTGPDLAEAASLCTKPADFEYIRRRTEQLAVPPAAPPTAAPVVPPAGQPTPSR